MKFTLAKYAYDVKVIRDDVSISISIERPDGELIGSYMIIEFLNEGFRYNNFTIDLIPAVGCRDSFLLVANCDKRYIYKLIFIRTTIIKLGISERQSVEEDLGKRISITQNIDVRVMNLVMDKSFIEEGYQFNQFLNHRLHDDAETTGIVIERDMQVINTTKIAVPEELRIIKELYYIMDEDLDSRPGNINTLQHISGFVEKDMGPDDVIIINKAYGDDCHTLITNKNKLGEN